MNAEPDDAAMPAPDLDAQVGDAIHEILAALPPGRAPGVGRHAALAVAVVETLRDRGWDMTVLEEHQGAELVTRAVRMAGVVIGACVRAEELARGDQHKGG